jgi:diacylglycerol kinase (ATP)
MTPLPKSCFLIVNPTSGSYSQGRLDLIMAALLASGLDPVLLPTASSQDATLFASEICAENPDPLILVAGGDGTINGVLNGLPPGVATLAVIPFGTSNVLARELNIRSVDDAIRRIVRGTTRSMTVGEIRCGGRKGLFLLMAGVGVDGAVVKGVRLGEKRVLGKGAYLLSALRVLFDWDQSEVRVAAGGRSVSCHSVIVCNSARYGGNFLLAPQADISSPTFEVVCIKGGPLGYLKRFLFLACGRFAAGGPVEIFAASELEVAGEKAVQVDGDFFGCAPLSVRALPHFLRLIV